MSPKRLHSHTDISIQKVKLRHLDQIADIYYKYMSGDFVGSCGRYVFINYLNFIRKSKNGSLWCAANTEGQIIGFAASVIDDKYMNRQWVLLNLTLLCPLVMKSILFSHDFHSFLYKRISNKFKGGGKISTAQAANNPMHGKRLAYLKWILVDKTSRGTGIASRLLTSIETDARIKGVDQILSYVEHKNAGSKSLHLKNGWEIIAENTKRFKLVKKIE